MKSEQPALMLSTCSDHETATKIAETLVERRLAACVSVRQGFESTYRWRGKIEKETESLLVIKTLGDRAGRVEEVIKQQSGYEVPELIVLEIVGGSADYLDWLIKETKESR